MRTEEDRITVLFDEVGYKKLSLSAVEEAQLLRLDQHRGARRAVDAVISGEGTQTEPGIAPTWKQNR